MRRRFAISRRSCAHDAKDAEIAFVTGAVEAKEEDRDRLETLPVSSVFEEERPYFQASRWKIALIPSWGTSGIKPGRIAP